MTHPATHTDASENWLKKTIANGLAGMVLGIALFLGSIVGVIMSWGHHIHHTMIVQEGGLATATVTKKVAIHSDEGTSEYAVEYSYQVPGGKKVTAERDVPSTFWGSINEGSKMDVFYDHNDPRENVPGQNWSMPSFLVLMMSTLALSCLSVIGGVAAYTGWRDRRRARRQLVKSV